MESEDEIMNDIKRMVRDAEQQRRKANKVNENKSPYHSNVKAPKKKTVYLSKTKSALLDMNSVDEYLSKLVAQKHADDHGLSSAEVQIKSRTLPFQEELTKIKSFIHTDNNYPVDSKERMLGRSYPAYVDSKVYDANDRKTINKTLKSTIEFSKSANLDLSTVLNAKNINSTPLPLQHQVQKFRKKYPRLCEHFTLTNDDLNKSQSWKPPSLQTSTTDTNDTSDNISAVRSGTWLCKFMESCYDEAYKQCNTAVVESRFRLRNGLDLQSFDAFPHVVNRYLSQLYSKLEVRNRVLYELLMSIDCAITLEQDAGFVDVDTSERLQHNDKTVELLNLSRASLFSSFLSEEYDCDVLAMFLSNREMFQATVLRLRLRDLVQTRVWTTDVFVQKCSSTVLANNTRTEAKKRQRTFSDDEDDPSHDTSTLVSQRHLHADDVNSVDSVGHKQLMGSWGKHFLANVDDDDTVDSDQQALSAASGDVGSPQQQQQQQKQFLLPTRARKLSRKARSTNQLKHSVSSAALGTSRVTTALTSRAATATSVTTTEIVSTTGAATLTPLKAKKQRFKIVPVELPRNFKFLNDFSLIECPAVAFHVKLLPVVVMQVLPQSSRAVRTYFIDKLCAALIARLLNRGRNALDTTALHNLDLTKSTTSSVQTGRILDRDSIQYIPVYLVLSLLCEEFKKVPFEARMKFIATESTAENLTALYHCYDNDCALLRGSEKEIADTEIALTLSNARLLNSSKNVRRLERKFQSRIITEEELLLLADEKDAFNAESLVKLELESTLQHTRRRQQHLTDRIEQLWQQATNPNHRTDQPLSSTSNNNYKNKQDATKSRTLQTTKSGRGLSKTVRPEQQRTLRHHVAQTQWRVDVRTILVHTIAVNIEGEIGIAAAKQKFQAEQQQFAASDVHIRTTTAGRVITPLQRYEDPFVENGSKVQFIHDIVGKIAVQNAIREATRRATLKLYLNTHEIRLKVHYKDKNYLESERLRIEEERQRRLALKLRELTIKYANIFSYELVNDALHAGLALAFEKLFDYWSLLDIPMERWLDPRRIAIVNNKYVVSRRRSNLHHLRLLFHFLSLRQRVKKYRRRLHFKLLRIMMVQFVVFRNMARREHACARVLQRLVQCYLNSCRYYRYIEFNHQLVTKAQLHHQRELQRRIKQTIQHWHRKSNLQNKFKRCQFNRLERRFLITFYTWRHLFKQRRLEKMRLDEQLVKACLVVQKCIRSFIALRLLRKKKAQRQIQLLGKNYLSRKRVHQQRCYLRRVGDLARFAAINQDFHQQKICFQQFYRAFMTSRTLHRLHIVYAQHKMRKRFNTWQFKADKATRKRARAAVKLQAVVRKVIVLRRICDYFKFRVALRKLQGLQRRRMSLRQFYYDIYFYRAAKRIQRLVRGNMVRRHLNERRLVDIHYAARTNNYDKLLFYTERYPELVDTLDKYGDSPLHSAAQGAAKRTLKLLAKLGLDVNATNYEGYTPFHCLIMSDSVGRDELAVYMLDRGFDEDIDAPGGRSCLLLACEYGRTVIATELLKNGMNANAADENSFTCLQHGCRLGVFPIVRELIAHDAEVNAAGNAGTFPVHDCVTGGNVEVAKELLANGAFLNVYEPLYYQTPLMWACQAGQTELLKLFILQGADVNAQDYRGMSAVHYSVYSDSEEVYQAMREADADYDAVDIEGNTPLHLAAEFDATVVGMNILHGMAYPSHQNIRGDQPAHIAARYNNVELIKYICQYDEHIGRVNHEHQTPLGVARFYSSEAVIQFLTKHYRHIQYDDSTGDGSNARNKVGDIWWDKDIDEAVEEWQLVVDSRGERTYVNQFTAEVRITPPTIAAMKIMEHAKMAEVPLTRKVVRRDEDNTLNKHNYREEYLAMTREIEEMTRENRASVVINKFARRKLAYLAKHQAEEERRVRKLLRKFMKKYSVKFKQWRVRFRTKAATTIQRCFRGYRMRRDFFTDDGEYFQRYFHYKRLRIRVLLWHLWTRFKRIKELQFSSLSQNAPVTLHDWQILLDQARKPVRTIGVYEEYVYPGTTNIHFYRHATTGTCSFTKPKKIAYLDQIAYHERKQTQKYGATLRQLAVIVKLQALYRGHKVRSYSQYVEQAMEISLVAESNYLTRPTSDLNLFNYALHCHVVLLDFDRARRLYVECLRRMQKRGPDVAFVLYSYAIFAFVSHDLDYTDVVALLERGRAAEFKRALLLRVKSEQKAAKNMQLSFDADENASADSPTAKRNNKQQQQQQQQQMNKKRDTDSLTTATSVSFHFEKGDDESILSLDTAAQHEAETYPYGKIYSLANIGFFRNTALGSQNHRFEAWENFAACRFLVFNDFNGAFDAYLWAFRWDPENRKLKRNFDIMMRHFHGKQQDHLDAVVRERMQHHASLDAEVEEMRRQNREAAKLRAESATRLQTWYIRQRGQRVFNLFMASVRQSMRLKREQLTAHDIESRASSRNSHQRSTDQSRGNSRVVSPMLAASSSREGGRRRGIRTPGSPFVSPTMLQATQKEFGDNH